MSRNTKQLNRQRRHNRIRARLAGTSERPRLSIYKSNRYLHAQIVDDTKGTTLLSGDTRSWQVKKMESATKLGETLGKKAKEAGITAVVFDRGGFRYTGRIAALAEALRNEGLTL